MMQAYCAHLNVLYVTRQNADSSTTGWWECRDCKHPFWPVEQPEAAQPEHQELYDLFAKLARQHADDDCQGALKTQADIAAYVYAQPAPSAGTAREWLVDYVNAAHTDGFVLKWEHMDEDAMFYGFSIPDLLEAYASQAANQFKKGVMPTDTGRNNSIPASAAVASPEVGLAAEEEMLVFQPPQVREVCAAPLPDAEMLQKIQMALFEKANELNLVVRASDVDALADATLAALRKDV